MQPLTKPLNALIGAGRSGTTWLGSIIDSHPDVIYRFEPFHRLQDSHADIKSCVKLFDDILSDKDLEKIYQLLFEADPLTSKPPFFKKTSCNRFAIKWFWMTSRQFRPAKLIYQKLYTPAENSPLVFKEVTYERRMRNLLANTSMPVTYLVRHPCGTVLSESKGQASGNMPTARQNFLKRILKEHDHNLFARYESEVDGMSSLEKTTLLWRIDLEKGVSAIKDTGRGLLLTYEQLCDDPYLETQRVFKNFGLQFVKETEDFIDSLFSVQEKPSKLPFKGDWMRGFFTVYRNPKKQKSAWKNKISNEDRETVMKLVRDSEAFQYCASLGGWD